MRTLTRHRRSQSRRRRALALGGLLALLGSFVYIAAGIFPAAAQITGARLGGGPEFPLTTTVGAKGVAVDLTFINISQQAQGSVTIPANTIKFVPSCGTLPAGASLPCPTPDPGVFAPSSLGTGKAGTECAGASFTITPVAGSPDGEFQFMGPAVVLSGTDANNANGGVCVINFTVDVLKAPTLDVLPDTPGIQTGQLANAPGVSQLGAPAGCCGSSFTTVSRVTPAITTQASPATTLGGVISDTATLTGGDSPTGTVTMTFYGPTDTNCTGTAVFTAPPIAVNGNKAYTSAPYTPTVPGTYRSIASYSGDLNNNPVATKCNDAGESVVVSAPAPKPTPSTSVLGTSLSKKPILPVTGPTTPVGPLALLAAGLVLAGAALLGRSRLRDRRSHH